MNQMTPKSLGFIALMAAAALLGGCATNVNTVERADPRATPDYVADKRVVTDNSLARSVRVVSVNQSTVSGNLLKIQVLVENQNSSLMPLRYKFEWIDKDGMTLSAPADTWKTIRLQGREKSSITAVATNPRAVDFVLKMTEE